MEAKIKTLEELGCDIEGAMDRFLEDEEFYIECYDKVIHEPCFEKLENALKEHDIQSAFEYAHILKGLLANLGLTSLFAIVCEIVEVLREKDDEGLLEKYQLLMKEREKYPQNGIKS